MKKISDKKSKLNDIFNISYIKVNYFFVSFEILNNCIFSKEKNIY